MKYLAEVGKSKVSINVFHPLFNLVKCLPLEEKTTELFEAIWAVRVTLIENHSKRNRKAYVCRLPPYFLSFDSHREKKQILRILDLSLLLLLINCQPFSVLPLLCEVHFSQYPKISGSFKSPIDAGNVHFPEDLPCIVTFLLSK